VIIDKAAPPRLPSSPKIKQSVFLAVLLGLIGGIGLAFLREHLDDTVKAPEEVQRYLNLPNLGVVPDFLALNWRRGTAKLFPYRPSQIPICLPAVAEPRLLLSYHPLSVVTAAYRTLRTAILLSRAEKPPQTLLFTSAVHGEGKTATAVNTAIVLAQTGVNVLIIDADLRRSRCHEILGADREPGLTEVLTGLHAPQDLIQPTYTDGLFFLGAGSTPPNPPDLVGSKMMHTALASLQEHYDYILIDSPPVVAVSDAVLLSTLVEGVILVVDVQHTLNRVDLRTGTYAYY
jgi:polysaccharide biosynthesis transport protein